MKINVEIDFNEREMRTLLGGHFIETIEGESGHIKRHIGEVNQRMLEAFINEKLGEYFKSVILKSNAPEYDGGHKLKL